MYIILIYSTSIQMGFELIYVIYDTMNMEAQSNCESDNYWSKTL